MGGNISSQSQSVSTSLLTKVINEEFNSVSNSAKSQQIVVQKFNIVAPPMDHCSMNFTSDSSIKVTAILQMSSASMSSSASNIVNNIVNEIKNKAKSQTDGLAFFQLNTAVQMQEFTSNLTNILKTSIENTQKTNFTQTAGVTQVKDFIWPPGVTCYYGTVNSTEEAIIDVHIQDIVKQTISNVVNNSAVNQVFTKLDQTVDQSIVGITLFGGLGIIVVLILIYVGYKYFKKDDNGGDGDGDGDGDG